MNTRTIQKGARDTGAVALALAIVAFLEAFLTNLTDPQQAAVTGLVTILVLAGYRVWRDRLRDA